MEDPFVLIERLRNESDRKDQELNIQLNLIRNRVGIKADGSFDGNGVYRRLELLEARVLELTTNLEESNKALASKSDKGAIFDYLKKWSLIWAAIPSFIILLTLLGFNLGHKDTKVKQHVEQQANTYITPP